MIRGIGHVETWVTDLERSTDFYSRLLGAQPVHRDAGHAHFKVISHDLILRQSEGMETLEAAGDVRFGVEVIDAVAFQHVLQARGIAVSVPPARTDEGWMVGSVADPDGHSVEFVQKDLPH